MLRSATVRLAFAPDGKTLYLATGSGRILRWNVADGRALPDWPARGGLNADLFFRPGKMELISAGKYDGMIRRWDAATGKTLSATGAYAGRITVARTPDGNRVAVGDVTGRVDVWDIATGRVAQTLRLPADGNRCLTYSPDGRLLLDSTGGKIIVRDADSGRANREIPDGNGDMTFSPDGQNLFVSGEGCGMRLLTWPCCTVVWRQAELCIAAFSPDGKQRSRRRPVHEMICLRRAM